MTARIEIGGLKVHPALASLVQDTICPDTGFSPQYFWTSLGQVVKELTPELNRCLKRRDELQERIDAFYTDRKKQGHNLADRQHRPACRSFLRDINYLVADNGPISVTTQFIDKEVALIPAPQLVCPSDNARYVLNALNARWGSLFDALYGFDVIPETPVRDSDRSSSGYNPVRGEAVIAFANALLDEITPLAGASWSDVVRIWPRYIGSKVVLAAMVQNGDVANQLVGLKSPKQFVGFSGSLGPPQGHSSGAEVPSGKTGDQGRIFLEHHGLHVVLEISRDHPVGKENKNGIFDITMEGALTAIIDMEDSVAAVDAEEKCVLYGNINGIFRGSLSAPFMKGGKAITRKMNEDVLFRDDNGCSKTLPGTAVCLVRNVGHHMFTDAALTAEGNEIPEGFLDCFVTVASALQDLRGTGRICNSRAGSIYIVKPKQHGPEEIDLTCQLFTRVEELFGLQRNTIKMGIMDEERRTSVNLRQCIRAASERVFFINTGFLDRTGDEIHTCMHAGPVVKKAAMKQQPWIKAYEASNVDIGIHAGMQGKGQIGKGMWPKPDSMKAMLESKIGELMTGASTAWVPSPTGATLHSIHYHRCDVHARQSLLALRPPAKIDNILEPPLLTETLDKETIMHEVKENAQSILGYVVRWVDLGIGCSKVPDLANVGLMEDRATLRISSQLLANWLKHGLVTEDVIRQVFHEMAAVVDKQNAREKDYRPMSGNLDTNIAYQAALQLVLDGQKAPNGYTEFTLHDARRKVKASTRSRL
jgi:malate synthase